jgi:hypothetical protein
MIRKSLVFLAILIVYAFNSEEVKSQVLEVPEIIQEMDQWCWAAVSKCVMDYYGHVYEQCEIAEYTRSVATWHNFGSLNCCVNPNQGCNYWNYNWGTSGSIADILNYFANITTQDLSTSLSYSQIQTQINLNRPFIIRWGWTLGGGHFVVGHGCLGNDIYYMDPWFNIGHRIADYNWVLGSSNHSWTHTQMPTSSPTGSNFLNNEVVIEVFPNPVSDMMNIRIQGLISDIYWLKVYSITGQLLMDKEIKNNRENIQVELNFFDYSSGIYILRLHSNEFNYYIKVNKI